MSARGGVVDGQASVSRVGAGRQHYGIERERRAHQHSDDVESRGNERKFVFLFANGIDHRAQASEHKHRNQVSDGMLLVVVENGGLHVAGCD